jgi:endoglucanase
MTGRVTALVAVLVCMGALACVGARAPMASAGVANAGIAGAPANPIAGLRWGIFTHAREDGPYAAWLAAEGEDKRLLAKIALAPRVRWYGDWVSDSGAQSAAERYIDTVTGGDPDVLSQVAVFRLHPWEGAACRQAPTAADVASYRTWIDNFARGIGSARVALILQPDLPFVLCVPRAARAKVYAQVAYAARVFDALPHTTVYIEVGSADWPTARQAATMLERAGIRHVRGFATNATHYNSTAAELVWGQRILGLLARAGIRGKHFVVNTAANGHPFAYQEAPRAFAEIRTCRSFAQRRCVSLGIPPTTDVANPRWKLPKRARTIAQRSVDAYLWIGRPWLKRQSNPFLLEAALAQARWSPF